MHVGGKLGNQGRERAQKRRPGGGGVVGGTEMKGQPCLTPCLSFLSRGSYDDLPHPPLQETEATPGQLEYLAQDLPC